MPSTWICNRVYGVGGLTAKSRPLERRACCKWAEPLTTAHRSKCRLQGPLYSDVRTTSRHVAAFMWPSRPARDRSPRLTANAIPPWLQDTASASMPPLPVLAVDLLAAVIAAYAAAVWPRRPRGWCRTDLIQVSLMSCPYETRPCLCLPTQTHAPFHIS